MNSSDILFLIISLIVGIIIGFVIRQLIYSNKVSKQRDEADKILTTAKEEARNLEIQAKDKAIEIRQSAENEIAHRRSELNK